MSIPPPDNDQPDVVEKSRAQAGSLMRFGRAIGFNLGIAVVLVGALTFVGFLVLGFPGVRHQSNIELSTVLDVLKLAFAAVAGIGGVVFLVIAYRRQRITEVANERAERSQAHTERDATERRVTELYGQAVGQLGHAAAAVRLGGLYSLERLGQDHPLHRQTVVDVVCAYLRMPFALPPAHTGGMDSSGAADEQPVSAKSTDAPHEPVETGQELQVRLAAQRLLTRHLSVSRITEDQPARAGGYPEGFWGGMVVDLTGAVLIDFDFSSCRAVNANFDRSQFKGDAEFRMVYFAERAEFNGARFDGAAGFEDAQIGERAFFRDVQFNGGTRFRRARFGGAAEFSEAKFSGRVEFREARFGADARFDGAQFDCYAEFGGARFSGGAEFRGARFSGTQFSTTGPRGRPVSAQFKDIRPRQVLKSAGFIETQFGGDARFGSQFDGNVEFTRARFIGIASFLRMQFTGDAQFKETQFGGDVWFDGRFSKEADFTRAQFSKEARFTGVIFDQTAEFGGAQFGNDAEFSGTQFNRSGRFEDVRFDGKAGFHRASFSKGATFRKGQFGGDAQFAWTEFGGDADFWFTRFTNDVDFGGAEFGGKVGFFRSQFSGNAQFGKAHFRRNLEFQEARFDAAAGFAETRFDGVTQFNEAQFCSEPDFTNAITGNPSAEYVWPVPWVIEPTSSDSGLGRLKRVREQGHTADQSADTSE